MFERLASVVTTWHFATALFTLLLNDRWLKTAYPGVLTGKLSDFAGLAVVGLLVAAAWPRRHIPAFLGLAAAFLFWKSPLSDPLIQFLNDLSPVSFGRTVDYSDLLALIVVPGCYRAAARRINASTPTPNTRRYLAPPLFLATLLGIMGTSVVPTRQEYVVRYAEGRGELRRDQVADLIATVAAKHEMSCTACADLATSATYRGNGITMTYTISGVQAIAFRIDALPNGLYFGATGDAKAERLRAALKAALAERFRGLEYVEQLTPWLYPR